MQKFSSDLDSRVRSFPSLRNAPLIPVVEAVWNAYDAIAERTFCATRRPYCPASRFFQTSADSG